MKVESRETYSAIGGINTSIVPWRLWEKAKRLMWNPADIDFTQDAEDWKQLADDEKRYVMLLASEFLAGEEAVTLDILPLLKAMANQGRLEETMYLTTFAFEEAKHVDFFRRWFDAVGIQTPDDEYMTPTYAQVFNDELPRVLGRLDADDSQEAILDAALTYNQFIEGVLAITGYWTWNRIFTLRGIMPGLREGLVGTQRDERRHMAYGTYLCRRIIAERPDLWTFVEDRMGDLQMMGLKLIEEGTALFTEPYPFDSDPAEVMAYAMTQVPRRLEVIEVARRQKLEEVETSTMEEDLEEELEKI